MDSNLVITIPTTPPRGLLESMAMRYNHSFWHELSDTDIELMRAENLLWGRQFLTSQEKKSLLGTMRQLHEEVVGKGFYKYD